MKHITVKPIKVRNIYELPEHVLNYLLRYYQVATENEFYNKLKDICSDMEEHRRYIIVCSIEFLHYGLKLHYEEVNPFKQRAK